MTAAGDQVIAHAGGCPAGKLAAMNVPPAGLDHAGRVGDREQTGKPAVGEDQRAVGLGACEALEGRLERCVRI